MAPKHTDVRALFHAGRFNADPDDPAGYIERCLGIVGRPHVIGLDETFAQHMPDLRDLLNPLGYRVTRMDENVIAWNRETMSSRGPLAKSGTLRRMSHVYPKPSERWQDPDMYTRRLVVRETGAKVTVDVMHSPSGIEFGNRFRPTTPKRGKAWRQSYAKAGRVIARRQHDTRPGPRDVTTILMHDTNADHGRKVWRDRVEDLTGLPSCWSVPGQVIHGTHRNWGAKAGKRAIDAINSDGEFVDTIALPWPNAGRFHFDHRAILSTIRIPAPVPVR